MKTTMHGLKAPLIAAGIAIAASGAWAWTAKFYWVGATSADYFDPANWNYFDDGDNAEEGHTPDWWRHGTDQFYKQSDIQSFRVDLSKKCGASRGDWNINAGTEAQPLEFYCSDASSGMTPNTNPNYNYASNLKIAENCDSYVWFNGGKYDQFNGAIKIGTASYAGHIVFGNGQGAATTMACTGDFNFSQGSVVVTNATLRVGGNFYVGNNGGTATLTIGAGGLVDVDSANAYKFTTCGSGVNGTINLDAGGTLRTTYIHNNSPLTIVFNGGTLTALPTERDWILQRGLIADTHNVTVTELGGTIDANSSTSAVVNSAIGGTGGMTYKGGGRVTLAVQPTYTGTTTIEIGTVLVVPEALDWTKVSIVLPASGLAKGTYEVLRLSSGGTLPDDLIAQVTLPSDSSASFMLNPGKTALYCVYGMSSANCVAKWDFNNYDSADPTSAGVLQATIGGNAKPRYKDGSGSDPTADGSLGKMYVVSDSDAAGLGEGNYAIAIPAKSHVALPIPESVKNHAWTLKIRFWAVNEKVWRCFFNRNNTTDGDLFIKNTDKNQIGGGQFAGTGNYNKQVSKGVWHTLTVSSSESRYEIDLDGSVPLAIVKNSGERFNYFADPAEALTDIDGVGHLLLCADENGEDDLMYIDYVELYDGLLDNFPAGAKVWTGFAGNGSMSDPENWSDGVAPVAGDVLDFSPIAQPTALAADFEGDIVFPTARFGTGVVTLTGSLHLDSLTNAWTLAVASGATLTIDNYLVSYAENDSRPLLYSNYGTVTVGKRVDFRSAGPTAAESIVCQYAVADANSTPIVANGLAYNAHGWSDYLVAKLGSLDNGLGKWVVGAGGFTVPSSRQIDRSGFRITGNQAVTLYSSADWTLAKSYRNHGNDLYIRDTAAVTIDTTDWNDHTTGRTVTLKGYINAQGTAETPLTVTGCGKVVLDSTTANNHTNVVTGAIAVTDGATLQINKDVVIGGTGSIALAAGATLAFPANDDKTISVRDIVPLTLPESGIATLRIDGARLPSGEYTILNSVPANYANLAVDRKGTAIAGRYAELTDDGTNLKLQIFPSGTAVKIR